MSGVLVDTSVWRRFFAGDAAFRGLADLLDEPGDVVVHPWVLGELVVGGLAAEERRLLEHLPSVQLVDDASVLEFIERRALARRGLGWVDVHLLASALASACPLWSADKDLSRAAAGLKVSFRPPGARR